MLALLDFGFCILDFQVVLDFVCWIFKVQKITMECETQEFHKVSWYLWNLFLFSVCESIKRHGGNAFVNLLCS